MLSRNKFFRILLISLLLMTLFSTTASAAKKVAIKTPLDGAEVSGLVTISGTGSGADTEVSIDGGPWFATSGGKSWSIDWDTLMESNDTHEIIVQYSDGSSTDSIMVTVNNGSSGPRLPVVGDVLINEAWKSVSGSRDLTPPARA